MTKLSESGWMKSILPSQKKAAADDAVVHWDDETGIKSNDHWGCGFAPKRKNPNSEAQGQGRECEDNFDGHEPRKLRFMIYEGSFNAQVITMFLTRLIKSPPKKVYLIEDNLRVRHAKPFEAWVEKRPDKIEQRYLPSYSPDWDPEDHLICDLKTELATHPERRTKGKFTKTVRSTMEKLQGLPNRIASYFDSKPPAYPVTPMRCGG